jgi:hypothetical protein
MHTHEAVRNAADHLRARAEVSRSQPTLLVTLILASAASAFGEDQSGWVWVSGLVLGLLLLPYLLGKALPEGNLLTYRMGLLVVPVQAFLLGFIVYLEAGKLPPIDLEDLPQLGWLVPALAMVVPLAYLVQQFPEWRRRIKSYQSTFQALESPGDDALLDEVRDLARRAVAKEASAAAPWAEFRTVPAAPGNWKQFLRLDVDRHGLWRVVFAQDYALVVAKNGSGLEAVFKGGLRIAADDPIAGGTPFLCLVRWNAHLHEGRIREGSLQRIQAWNLKTVPE